MPTSQGSSAEQKQPRRQQQQVYESDVEDASDDQQFQEPAPRQMQRRQQQQHQQSGDGPFDVADLDGVGDTAKDALGGVTNTLGGVAGSALQQGSSGGAKSDTLRLRLDLNLDIEITLKAKIHGDLELALLTG